MEACGGVVVGCGAGAVGCGGREETETETTTEDNSGRERSTKKVLSLLTTITQSQHSLHKSMHVFISEQWED